MDLAIVIKLSLVLFRSLWLATTPGCGHIVLTHPPARRFALDYLTNNNTDDPCVMPAGYSTRITEVATGSTILVEWKSTYKYLQANYTIDLLDGDGRLIPGGVTMVESRSSSPLQRLVRLTDSSYNRCALRISYRHFEWSLPNGREFIFRSCADIRIVQKRRYVERCSGNGVFLTDTQQCECHRTYKGDLCQNKDDCEVDADCSNDGKCVDTHSSHYPQKVCFCQPGWFGTHCKRESVLKDTNINYKDYSKVELSSRFQLYHKFIDSTDEVEIILRAKTKSWVALGWRPNNLSPDCKSLSHINALSNSRSKRDITLDSNSTSITERPTTMSPSTNTSSETPFVVTILVPYSSTNMLNASAPLLSQTSSPSIAPPSSPSTAAASTPRPLPSIISTPIPSTATASTQRSSTSTTPIPMAPTSATSTPIPRTSTTATPSPQTSTTSTPSPPTSARSTPSQPTTAAVISRSATSTSSTSTSTASTQRSSTLPSSTSTPSASTPSTTFSSTSTTSTQRPSTASTSTQSASTDSAQNPPTASSPPTSRPTTSGSSQSRFTTSTTSTSTSTTSTSTPSSTTSTPSTSSSTTSTPSTSSSTTSTPSTSSSTTSTPSTSSSTTSTPSTSSSTTSTPSTSSSTTSTPSTSSSTTSTPSPSSSTPSASTSRSTQQPAISPDHISDGLHGMDCTDMVIGMAYGDLSRVADYFSLDRSTPQMDEFFGGSQSLTGALGFEDGEDTVIMFRRKVTAYDHTDHSFDTVDQHVIWAIGQRQDDVNDFYKNDVLQFHGGDGQTGMRIMTFGKTESSSDSDGLSTITKVLIAIACITVVVVVIICFVRSRETRPKAKRFAFEMNHQSKSKQESNLAQRSSTGRRSSDNIDRQSISNSVASIHDFQSSAYGGDRNIQYEQQHGVPHNYQNGADNLRGSVDSRTGSMQNSRQNSDSRNDIRQNLSANQEHEWKHQHRS